MIPNQLFTIKELVKYLSNLFITSSTPRLDAEILICYCINKPRSYLYTWGDRYLTESQLQQLNLLSIRRTNGEPIAYIIGSCYFWTFKLKVTSATLIPRPETELLVEQALTLTLANKNTPLQVCDLGTGSGAIALALASERPKWNILAIDNNIDVLKVAQYNINTYAIPNINTLQTSWAEALADKSMDVIVSNPPYIASTDANLNFGDVAHEPEYALVATENGLADIANITRQAARVLKLNGKLLIEHGYKQAKQVQQLMHEQKFTNITTYQDLAGLDRITTAQNL